MEDRIIDEVSAIMGDSPAREILRSVIRASSGIAQKQQSLDGTNWYDVDAFTTESLWWREVGTTYSGTSAGTFIAELENSYFDIGRFMHTLICSGYNKRKPTRNKIIRRRNRAAERRRRKGLA